MQLFHTKVIPAVEDALWSLPDGLPHFAGCRLLIISTPFETDSPEEQTLHNMMAACKLMPGEYAVIQLKADGQISWQLLAAAGAPKRILLTGIMPAQLAISAAFILHAPNAFGGSTFIPAMPLAAIATTADIKKALWNDGLKPLFGL